MKLIPLTQGKFAIIDNDDFELVSLFKWYLSKQVAVTNIGSEVVDGKRRHFKLLMHRLIMSPEPLLCVHHVNGNGLDNRRSNLRVCTKQENNRAFRIKSKGKTSIYRGVCWDAKRVKWKAYIEFDGVLHNLGRFEEETQAAQAYNLRALNVFGEFAHLNKV